MSSIIPRTPEELKFLVWLAGIAESYGQTPPDHMPKSVALFLKIDRAIDGESEPLREIIPR